MTKSLISEIYLSRSAMPVFQKLLEEVCYLLIRLKNIKLFLGNMNYAGRSNVNKQSTHGNKKSELISKNKNM